MNDRFFNRPDVERGELRRHEVNVAVKQERKDCVNLGFFLVLSYRQMNKYFGV